MATMMVPPPPVQIQPPGNLVNATPPPTPMTATAHAAAAAGGRRAGTSSTGVFSNSSLYVGDLDTTVDESRLYDLFNQVAPVVSVRVCRDQNYHFSLGYAYVNFSTSQDASNAMDALNFTPVNGKPIRIMFSHRDPTLRKSGYANIFAKNLDSSIDNKALYEIFAAFGTVLSCKVAIDNNGKSKGYGFVQYEKAEAAQNAIKQLNGTLVKNKQVYVGTFIRRQERNRGKGSPIFTNVYVKNFSESITDDGLNKMFGKFGPITSAVVMKDANGKSRCFGFVNFESPDAAMAAIENLNGSSIDDKVLYVGKAEKKSEREAVLRAKFQQERNSRFEKLKGANLYLKNLDDGINEEKLKELFSEFGTITSCKIMVDQNGASKGAGFVAFSTPEEAAKALNEMNGKVIARKPLYAAVAQRKEERKAWLQAHFAQMCTPGTMSPSPGLIPAATPTLLQQQQQQQLYLGQMSPGLIPPQAAGYGFQHQHLQQTVPSNYILPFQFQQAPPPQRLDSRRSGNSPQCHSNQGLNRYMANPRNGMNGSIVPQSLLGPMMPLPFDANPVPPIPLDFTNSMPLSRSTLASALAFASPENQRMMLGEQLYPLVERLERKNAGKVTGMLLEMDQTEVLHLIESPDALRKKVGEAIDVLRLAASTDVHMVGNHFRSY